MTLTRNQVTHVAELAKLELTEAEIVQFQQQLSAILEHAARLDQLDTAAIPPTATVLPLRNVMRPDEIRPSFSRETMLANAPATQDGCIQVQAVLD